MVVPIADCSSKGDNVSLYLLQVFILFSHKTVLMGERGWGVIGWYAGTA